MAMDEQQKKQLMIVGAIGGGAHTSDEYVLLAPIPSRVALLAGLILAETLSR